MTDTIAMKWKEKLDAVVVDCYNSMRLCGGWIFFRATHFSLGPI